MKYRFRILEPGSTGSPSYDTCTPSPTVLNKTNLGLVLSIDGQVIWTETNLAAPVLPACPITTTAHSIVINSITIENTDYVTIDIGLTNSWNSTTLGLTVTKANYNTFYNLFEIYGYDLGNNVNVVRGDGTLCVNNPNMDIVMVATNYGIYTRNYSSFATYRKPFTDRIYFYKTSSSIGSSVYRDYNDTLLYSGDNSFIESEELTQIKLTTTSASIDGSSFSCTKNQTVGSVNWMPDINAAVDCDLCSDSCTNRLADNQVVPSLNYVTGCTTTYISDVKSYYYTDQNLEYYVFAPGTTPDDNGYYAFASQTYSYSIGSPFYTFDPTTHTWTFNTLDTLGDYIVQVVLAVMSGTTKVYYCTKLITITNCNFYNITQPDCNVFRVNNYSTQIVEYSLYEFNGTTYDAAYYTGTIPAYGLGTGYVDVTFAEDGIYKITICSRIYYSPSVYVTGNCYSYIVFNYCNLRTCFKEYADNLISCNSKCSDNTKCSETNTYNFNSMVILAHTYFSALNEYYNFGNIFNSIDIPSDKLSELHEIDEIMTKLSEYCEDCSDPCDCIENCD